MKKFMKVCAIIALAMCLLGIVLASLAGSIKGRETINEVVENVTDGKVNVKLNGWSDWGVTIADELRDNIGNANYVIEDAISFSKKYDILKGNVEKYSLGSDIDSLDIEVGGCTFETAVSGDDCFYIEVEKAGKFQAYVEDKVLYVLETPSSRRLNDIGECEITFYIPEGKAFHKMDIELGAGSMKLKNLHADEVSLSVGAGRITVNGIQADSLDASVGMGQMELREFDTEKLDAEIGMGELIADGNIRKEAMIECAMGNIEMDIKGSQKDFNYEVEGAMGNISIGRDSYGGFASERTIDNNADKVIDISGSMGNISLEFTE